MRPSGAAEALGGIAEQPQPLACGNGPMGAIIGRLAEQIDRDHARRSLAAAFACRDGASRLAGSRLKVSGSTSTNTGSPRPGRTTSAVAAEGEDGTEHGVARPIPQAISGRAERIGAVGAGHDMLHGPAERGEFFLELEHLGAHDELA